MNNLLEEKTTRINTLIKGTDIAVFENLDSLDEEKIERVKETIRFLLEYDKLLISSQYVSVRSQDETWSIVDIVGEIMDEDTDFRDITTYNIIKGKKNLINNVNQWIGEDGKYKTEGEVFNCIEFKGDIYKIRKGLYLMNIDGYC